MQKSTRIFTTYVSMIDDAETLPQHSNKNLENFRPPRKRDTQNSYIKHGQAAAANGLWVIHVILQTGVAFCQLHLDFLPCQGCWENVQPFQIFVKTSLSIIIGQRRQSSRTDDRQDARFVWFLRVESVSWLKKNIIPVIIPISLLVGMLE